MLTTKNPMQIPVSIFFLLSFYLFLFRVVFLLSDFSIARRVLQTSYRFSAFQIFFGFLKKSVFARARQGLVCYYVVTERKTNKNERRKFEYLLLQY